MKKLSLKNSSKPFFNSLIKLIDTSKKNETADKEHNNNNKPSKDKDTTVATISCLTYGKFYDSTESSKCIDIIALAQDNTYTYEGFLNNKYSEFHFDYIDENEIGNINMKYYYYEKYFFGKEHLNFLITADNNVSILSIKNENNNENYRLKYIFRTIQGNENGEIKICKNFNLSIFDILKHIDKNLKIKKIEPAIHPMASTYILQHDQIFIKKSFSFALIYQKNGQNSENEILANNEHSEQFENFINFIGQKIKLKNFEKFRGGLDTLNDSTGEYSIYEQYESAEIMFHVSTLLPFSNKDEQQLEKKRFIGNDRVAIIFQDKDCYFSPSMINSKLLHVFIVISYVTEKTYKLSVISRREVAYFGPFLRKPCIFVEDKNLKMFLYAKLINAEYATQKSNAFNTFNNRILNHSLSKTFEKLKYSSNEFLKKSEVLKEKVDDNILFKNNLNNSQCLIDTTCTENQKTQYVYQKRLQQRDKLIIIHYFLHLLTTSPYVSFNLFLKKKFYFIIRRPPSYSFFIFTFLRDSNLFFIIYISS